MGQGSLALVLLDIQCYLSVYTINYHVFYERLNSRYLLFGDLARAVL